MSDIVERLRAPAYWLSGSDEGHEGENYAPLVAASEIERLRAALREAFEIYAGMDGFIPETAGEGYVQEVIKKMVDCINSALTGSPLETGNA